MKSLLSNFSELALSRTEMKNVKGGDTIYCSFSVWYGESQIVGLGSCSLGNESKCYSAMGASWSVTGASHVKIYGCYTAPGGSPGWTYTK